MCFFKKYVKARAKKELTVLLEKILEEERKTVNNKYLLKYEVVLKQIKAK